MKNLIFLALGTFTVGCSSFLIAGLLPNISQTIGQSIALTGQGITAFSLFYFLSAPLFSIFIMNKSVKNITQFALTMFIFGNLITLVSENIAEFLLGRALAGLGAGIFTPLCTTIAVHSVNPAAKGRVLSFIWGASTAGLVFGVPFGLYLSLLFNWQSSMTYIVILSLFALIGFSIQNTEIILPQSPSFRDKFLLFIDKKVLSVIGITCFTSLANLGLYSYIASIQSGSPNSLPLTLFSWGLGAFIGSSLVGVFIDRTKKPQIIMAFILAGLTLTLILIPFVKNIPYFGLVPFFMWGVLGWATISPQQHILYELHERQGNILVAINASAIGLGGALGTTFGGLIVSSKFLEIYLPVLAAMLLLVVFICQLILIKKTQVGV